MGYIKWDFDGEAPRPRKFTGNLTINGIECGPATITLSSVPMEPELDGGVIWKGSQAGLWHEAECTFGGFADDSPESPNKP